MARKNQEQKEREKSVDIGAAVRSLLELRANDRAEKESNPAKAVETALLALPGAVREQILGKLALEREEFIFKFTQKLEAEGFKDKKLTEEFVAGLADSQMSNRAEKEALTFREAYEDKRFLVGEGERMPKDEYAKAEIQDEIDALFASEPKVEDLKKIARLSFDANGLKAANDLSASHEKGTEFLRRIAEVFHNPNGKTRKFLKENGVDKILATTGGGDEYGVMLVGDSPIAPEVISEAIKSFEEEVAGLDMSDLVDFEDEGVLMRFGGVSESEALRWSKEERDAKIKEIKAQIPKGAEFKATVSGGGATLADGLERALSETSGDRGLKDEEEYRRALQKIMGGIFDAADENAVRAKNEYKSALRESRDPNEKFYSQLLARTTEAREMERKIADQAKELAEAKAKAAEMKALLESYAAAGTLPPEVAKAMLEKLA